MLEEELSIAIETVRRASLFCNEVQNELVTKESIEKKDKSPVTIADFGAQAIIIYELLKHYPDIPIMAEEDSSLLETEKGNHILKKLLSLLPSYISLPNEKALLNIINRGDYRGEKNTRFWTIDPIDGTKGFLRQDKYAIALALIEKGEILLGVLGCPNLNPEGTLFYASKGKGAYATTLDRQKTTPIYVSSLENPKEAVFCESVESSHSSHEHTKKVASILGTTHPPVRIDGQCKYGLVASGKATAYLRVPTKSNYRENIWDHAAGYMLVKEAGGIVTDCKGKDLDFSKGQKLEDNVGIIASNGKIHDAIVKAVKTVMS